VIGTALLTICFGPTVAVIGFSVLVVAATFTQLLFAESEKSIAKLQLHSLLASLGSTRS
jgi:hypothetical protein